MEINKQKEGLSGRPGCLKACLGLSHVVNSLEYTSKEWLTKVEWN